MAPLTRVSRRALLVGSVGMAALGATAGVPWHVAAQTEVDFGHSATRDGLEMAPRQPGVNDIDVTSDGTLVVTSGEDGSIWIREGTDLAQPRISLQHGVGPVNSAISPDGKLLASGASDGTVRVWQIDDPVAGSIELPAIAEPTSLKLNQTQVAFTNDGLLIAGGDDQALRIWDTALLASDPLVIAHPDRVWAMAASPDGSLFATGDNRGVVRLWNLAEPTSSPEVLGGHMEGVKEMDFSPDGSLLATGGNDNAVGVWAIRGAGATPVSLDLPFAVYGVAFSPDGDTLAAGGAFDGIFLWTLGALDAQPVVMPTPSMASVWTLTFVPSGEAILAGLADGQLLMWDMATPEDRPQVVG